MTEGLTADAFTPHVGENFRPRGKHHVLTLVSIDTRRPPGWEQWPRQPFSLLFRGPRGDVLPEGEYGFDVGDDAYFAFHIIPIHTPAPTHQDYQAVFT